MKFLFFTIYLLAILKKKYKMPMDAFFKYHFREGK